MGLQAVESEKISFYARKILKKIESGIKIISLNSLRDEKYSLKCPIYSYNGNNQSRESGIGKKRRGD